MYARILGSIGLILITLLFVSECRSLRSDRPLFMGETKDITGFVTAIRGSARFKTAVVEIRYEYFFEDEKYFGVALKRGHLAKTQKGDSLLIEVSRLFPSRSYAIATYPLVGEF